MTAILTSHEINVLAELRNHTYKELAEILDIKVNTLRQITWRSFLKLGTNNLRDAQNRAARRGLIPKANDKGTIGEDIVAKIN